ncbi:DNA polymerase IV [Candidatus Gottesmanbacteria bacterium]|nr:DNA polymerase IV [Candidatus Gottesmanbacteria bacterium]
MIVAHLDMDAFFAACEERANPQFVGLGIVVGADPKNGIGRGVVSTANYQARKYGIHSAMPISTAWKLSQQALQKGEPKTVFLPVNGSYYSQVSEKIFSIVRKYVRVVEQSSVDEAYLDLSFGDDSASDMKFFGLYNSRSSGNEASVHESSYSRAQMQRSSKFISSLNSSLASPQNLSGYDKAIELIKKIKLEIKQQENLTATVGIGPNKLIAKMTSARFKPDGLTAIYPDEVEKFLDPLPIGDIPGVGPKSEEFFHRKNIYKVSDLKKVSKEQLASWMGKWGEDIYLKVRGIDDSPVTVEREIKSISEQETFENDTLSAAYILDRLNELAARVVERMKYDKVEVFKTVTIVVRFSDFTTKTRAHTLKVATNSLPLFKTEVMKLILPFLDRRENPQLKKIRLIGVGIEHFKEEENLVDKKEKKIIEQTKLFNT